MRVHVDVQIHRLTEDLLQQTLDALGELAGRISAIAFSGLTLLTKLDPFVLRPRAITNTSAWDVIVPEAHVRTRAEHETREWLVDAIEGESMRAAEAFLAYYDDSRAAVEASFASALTDLHHHATVALVRARDVLADGPDAVSRAQGFLDDWLRRVAALSRTVE
ncbi:MAG: hypothetical protein ACM31C_05870 [Acidobacteriota bacterium]